MHQHYQTNI